MDGPARKRSRSAAGGGGSTAARRGMFATMRFGKAQPWQSWGAARVERGTPGNLAQFGPTWREATTEQRAMRKRHAYTGRGLYTGRGGFFSDMWPKMWTATAPLRAMAGKWARSSTNPYVQAAGQVAGATGIGDYSTGVIKNDLIDGGSGQIAPSFAEGPRGVTISHREYITDIFGPEATGIFQNQTFGLNPALVQTFPWLSQVAANYEEYEFKQLIFTFNSTVTDFVSNSGQVGTVIMATQYNANDAPFANKQEMMEYDAAVSGKVSGAIMAGVECDPRQNSGSPGKYTRSGPVAPNEDVKTFDLGTLNVATSNTPQPFNNQALGELWVSYTVELRKPKFFVSRALQNQKDVWLGDFPYDAASPSTAVTTLDAITLGEGQQNRIGGLLAPTIPSATNAFPPATNKLYYRFPASFAGDVEVDIIGSRCTSTAQAYFTINLSNAGVGIIQLFDMWSNSAWTNAQAAASDTTTAGSPGALQYVGHYKIVTPTSAALTTDNVLTIDLNGAGAKLGSLTFSVKMYNTGLNYATTQQPIIQNPDTQLVESWPPA